ncbi:MAG: hypothetical protein ACPG8W_24650, partial [Candidatus Promineifilaceae bacterium]
MKFPAINSYDRDQALVPLPYGLTGEYNLLLLSYGAWHVWQFDTWLSFANRLRDSYEGFEYYALSIAVDMADFGRNQPPPPLLTKQLASRSVLTTYMSKRQLKQRLYISSDLNIAVLLVHSDGTIIWSNDGAWAPE